MQKINFKNLPDRTTPVIAERLNTMQNNVEAVSNFAGFIQMFAGSTAPNGWLMCDGSAVSRTTYADLFTVIGTTYGSGDGSTTFNLPNFKGKVPVGLNSNDTDFEDLGQTGGEKTHTLSIAEMPSHSHDVGIAMSFAPDGSARNKFMASGKTNEPATNYSYWSDSLVARNTGGGQAHNIMQPYMVVNYIIKT